MSFTEFDLLEPGSRNGNNMNPQGEIRSLIQKSQDGYTHRDLTQVDSFMELFTVDTEVVGTKGVKPGVDEW